MTARMVEQVNTCEAESSTSALPGARRRAAVVLAGGDGRRLEPYIRRLRGDALPKQYVTLYGRHSLLERTFKRVERLVLPDRIMTVVTRDHLLYPDVCRQLARRPAHTVVVQPRNRDTAPGLLLPLAYLQRRCEDAVVAVFPSDHYVNNDLALMQRVDAAFRTVEARPELLVLVGVRPDAPETDYGYVVPGLPISSDGLDDVWGVRRFIEKPGARQAAELMQHGALWNTSILVFRLRMFMDLLWCVAPTLSLHFMEIVDAIDTPRVRDVIDKIYQTVAPVNLSRGILELVSDRWPSRLAVLRVHDAFWSDWGVEHRILRDLRTIGLLWGNTAPAGERARGS
ncbi:MAG: sugar phosphate nucleotidyltransferase [Nitrospirota bacterium]